ncbi:hypothetical protein KBF61_02810 [Candidatus Saccharibacteria bacterium]|jgi:hypothetical protein|nr:hypothetical protein [Candidatus Saccharibacteria bacterium]
MVDAWELVNEDWQYSRKVKVETTNGKKLVCRTQVLPEGHNHGHAVKGTTYHSWLMPRTDFLRIARSDAAHYDCMLF